MDINKELSDTSSALYVLSTLMRHPQLLEEDYAVLPDDFTAPLQRITFTSIYNMEKNGAEHLTPQDIDLYIKTQPAIYDYYLQNKGFEWLQTTYNLTENSDQSQFRYYYNRLKKFSILRELVRAGIDISDFYDISTDLLSRDVEDEKLDAMSGDEIINHIREKLVSIEDKNIGRRANGYTTIDEGVDEWWDNRINASVVGLPMDGEYLNTITKGAPLGKLFIFSASTGVGKTRQIIDILCTLSMPYIVNHKIVSRSGYVKTMYFGQEQQLDEIRPLVLAHITGINAEKLQNGDPLSPEEQADVMLGLQIMKTFGKNLGVEIIPDPTIEATGVVLARHILRDGIQYIGYDYINSSGGILGERQKLDIREDVALRLLATKLKEICTTYNVFIASATQVNRSADEKLMRNETCIEGSKAIANKADFGCVVTRLLPGSEEMEMIQEILAQNTYPKTPNQVVDVYKNRNGSITAIKLFRYFDHGTCRSLDLFVTDTNYKPYLYIDDKPIRRAIKSGYEKIYNSFEELIEEVNIHEQNIT